MDNELKQRAVEETHSRTPFICACALFCGLYVLRDLIGIGISYYIIYAVAAAIVLTSRLEECIAFILGISTFANAGFTGVFCTLLLGCVCIRFFIYYKTLRIASVMLLLMCVLEVFHFVAGSHDLTGELITYVTSVLCLLIIQRYPYNKVDADLVVNTVIAFSLFFVLMTIARVSVRMGSLGALIRTGFRDKAYDELAKGGGFIGNQNFVTSNCSLNLSLCLTMILNKRKKLPYLLAMAVFLFAGFLTISKMFVAVIIAVAVFLVLVRSKKNILHGVGALMLVGMLLVVVNKLFGNTLLKMLEMRFERGDLTTGRVDIIEDMFAYMEAHPFRYLVGLSILGTYNFINMGVHSSLFEVIGGWGYLGLLIVLVYMWSLVSAAALETRRNNGRIPIHNWIPLIMYLGYSVIGMLFSSGMAMIRMMVCIYALQLKEKE